MPASGYDDLDAVLGGIGEGAGREKGCGEKGEDVAATALSDKVKSALGDVSLHRISSGYDELDALLSPPAIVSSVEAELKASKGEEEAVLASGYDDLDAVLGGKEDTSGGVKSNSNEIDGNTTHVSTPLLSTSPRHVLGSISEHRIASGYDELDAYINPPALVAAVDAELKASREADISIDDGYIGLNYVLGETEQTRNKFDDSVGKISTTTNKDSLTSKIKRPAAIEEGKYLGR